MPENPVCPLPNANSTQSFWHSEPSSLLKAHRSTRDLPKQADVVIIGSGITGASIAHHLFNSSRSSAETAFKHDVVMLEAREACWGATGRNGGHCQPLLARHSHELSIAKFELYNFLALLKLVKGRKIACEWVGQPGVRGIYGQDTLEQIEGVLAKLQGDADLTGYMRVERDPGKAVQASRLKGADGLLVTDIAARLWPYKLVAHILEELLTDPKLNGTFNLQTLTPAEQLMQIDGGWRVRTSRGDIETKKVFLATNAYTSHLLPDFADLIQPCRGQMSALKPPAWLSGAKRLPCSIGFEGPVVDRYLMQRPNESGAHLMLGGGRLLGKSLGISDDSTIDAGVAAYLRTTLSQTIVHDGSSDQELEAANEWTGIMGWSRDGLPWVGQVPEKTGLFVSAGYTGHGMPNAWLCGKSVVEMMYAEHFGADRAQALLRAQKTTGLPNAYVLSKERIERVKQQDFVENLRDLKAPAGPAV